MKRLLFYTFFYVYDMRKKIILKKTTFEESYEFMDLEIGEIENIFEEGKIIKDHKNNIHFQRYVVKKSYIILCMIIFGFIGPLLTIFY